MTLLGLLKTRRFLPLFVTQFLGAFNGTLFKNACIVLILYRLAATPAGGQVLVTVAGGLFVLPFLLFSAIAGQLADHFDKARVIRGAKLFEIGAAAVAAVGLGTELPWLLLAAVFLLGSQAALFGPVKYGILPDHLETGELLAANGLIEAATFVAILAGTIAGSLSVLAPGGIPAVQAAVLATAAAGWLASTAVPSAPPRAGGLGIDLNAARQSWVLLRDAAASPDLLAAMMGVSWFWLVGATFLTQFPAFAKAELGADPEVVTLFLVMFTAGISVGSLLCQRLLKGVVSLRLAPIGAVGMAVFGADFALAGQPMAAGAALADAAVFLRQPFAWRLLADLVLLAAAGGVYVVPLYARLQQRADPAHRARVIAANNVLNALFMTAAAGGTAVLLGAGLSPKGLFLGLSAANLGLAGLSRWQARRFA